MPRHPDAIGYLQDLGTSEGLPWFRMICELAAFNGQATLSSFDMECAVALFTDNASYLIKTPSAGQSIESGIAPSATDFLQSIEGFTNFKRLQTTLQPNFTKRVTLIFGASGSGKSSLCESLKILANRQSPERPIKNVMEVSTSPTEFSYRFRNDSAAQRWTESSGYGLRGAIVKYFDSGIAIKNVQNAVEPGRVIELSPFKLQVFEAVQGMVVQLREELQKSKTKNAFALADSLKGIREKFERFKEQPLASVDEQSVRILEDVIRIAESFSDEVAFEKKKAEYSELQKATSEEGLKLLKAECGALETFVISLKVFIDSVEMLWAINPEEEMRELTKTQREQEVLAKSIVPTGATLEKLLSLVRPAAELCNLEAAAGHSCPLCSRELGTPEVELFRKYAALLAGEHESKIQALRIKLKKAKDLATVIEQIDLNGWDKSCILPAEIISESRDLSILVKQKCHVDMENNADAVTSFNRLNALHSDSCQDVSAKAKVIETAEKSRGDLQKKLILAQLEVQRLDYAKTLSSYLNELRTASRRARRAQFWSDRLPSFTAVLRKITTEAKDAYKELVVSDFAARLNNEYKALAEKEMTGFGVKLKDVGGDGTVMVLPLIGGREIKDVLSEGEQNIHALALFFAEIETCTHSVIVFDDPVSSLDFNYIANYCNRLRDFTQAHPTRQIIVLTHNWEFFVQLQTTLNGFGLNGQLSVQVLENCAVVADYSEKTNDLRTDICAILSVPTEPTKAQKEDMAGKMRRLIESVVNTHVFAKQRSQYKQKNQPTSEFQEFTKLVPLLPTEATTLRDLYAKLSIVEHDDPRNSYVNTDKATFQVRYDSIIAIEAAVVSRKLPPVIPLGLTELAAAPRG